MWIVRRRVLTALAIALVAPVGIWVLPSGSEDIEPEVYALPAVPHDLAAHGVSAADLQEVSQLYAVPPPKLGAVGTRDGDWVQTDTGPLGPADRDFLVRVRTAGLWEGPAGEMAQSRAGAARVKEVGQQLKADHSALDVQVRMAAAKLGVTIPDGPTAEQQGWLDEMAGARGAQFDQIFADRLRAAHGKVFAVVAAVRAGTRNETVRDFAQTANTVVLKHMTLLESTGIVRFDDLPTAAPPPGPTASTPSAGRLNPALVWLVLGIAAAAGLVAAARVVRPR